MLFYLKYFESVWGPFRLFGYISFRAVMALMTALLIGFMLGPWVIRKLKSLKAAQGMRDKNEVGRLAELHAGKKDTPTMGGVLIYIAITGSCILWVQWNLYVCVALLVYTGLTILGFVDDYKKIVKKNAKGVRSWVKLAVQGLLTLLSLGILLGNPHTHLIMSELWLPCFSSPIIQTMPLWFIFIFYFFVLAGTSNAINLTDGMDGLAIGCTIPSVLAYAIIAYFAGHVLVAEYLHISAIVGIGELTVLCACVLGAGLAFLWFNAHPAEIFMGDTGSLGLGGLIGSIAFMTHEPFTLIIIGGIFVLEALSVIAQIASFKLTHKRIFRMAPIHHHFELKGWPENKVVVRFWILSLLCALLGLLSLKLR